MVVRTYEFVKSEALCRDVPRLSLLDADRTRYVVRPPFRERIDPPDFFLDSSDVAGIGNGRPFGFKVDDGEMAAEAAFLARFDRVRVDVFTHTPNPANTFNVFVAPGVAVAETYGCRFSNQTLVDILKETKALDHDGTSVGVKLYDDAKADLHCSGEGYLLCSRFAFGNYFHWMIDGLSRLWALELFNRPRDVPLLLPFLTRPPFVTETLQALGITNPVVSLNCHAAQVDTLYFPSFYSPGGYSRQQIGTLSQRLRKAFRVEDRRQHRRIYISRNDARGRRVANEAQVLERLLPLGFECVTLSGRSMADQAGLFAEADVVVAPHGAGNTNMLFAAPGSTLIEVVPADTPNICYWLLTKQNGQRYGRMICQDLGRDTSMTFDVEGIVALAGQAIASSPFGGAG
ncbi:MAG: glycosyltransferase family 61 protein [Alphaproteobacteria bacterium]